MGVTGLWSILSELCERKPLTYLSGKKVAVDLSGWVVQAAQCKGLNTTRNPHVRNLFCRVSRLLQLGVLPIFVIEGKPPEVKEAYFKEKHWDNQSQYSSSSVSRCGFDKTLKQCEDLLSSLGVPFIKSSGEAEALCALLCLKGIVCGVITEDNDAFLYGADVVYRDFSIEPYDSHVNVYCLKSAKNKHNLDRKKLVALALLLGCDYNKGVPGVGKETAVKLLSELDCDDILQRFQDWKNLTESELFPGLASEPLKKSAHCGRCGHEGSSSVHKKKGCQACNSEITCYLPDSSKPCQCLWHINNELMSKKKTELKIYNTVKTCADFPDMKVVDEYLKFSDTLPPDDTLHWTCPNISDFQGKAYDFLGWTDKSSFDKILPLITAWQQYKLKTEDCDKASFLYEPVEILKERSIKDDTYFEVKWKSINDSHSFPTDDLITTEYGDQFSVSYKELVDDFYRKLHEQKQSKVKSKKFKSAEDNKKVNSETACESSIPTSEVKASPERAPSNVSESPFKMEIVTNSQCSLSANNLSTDSFNGLLDIPLSERIKILPKLLLKNNNQKTVPGSFSATDKLVNVIFNNSLDDSSVFSPFPEQFSSIEMSNRKKSINKLIFKFDKHVNDEITKKVEYSESALSGKESVFVDISDPDDSFLSILCNQKEKSKIIPDFEMSHIQVVENIVNNCDGSIELSLSPSKQGTYNSNIKNSTPLMKNSTPLEKNPLVSPCLLYSIQRRNSATQHRTNTNILFSESFSDSFPLVNDELLSKNSDLYTPKTPKTLSHVVFSPLVFESSIDEL